MSHTQPSAAYAEARERFADWNVDTDAALGTLDQHPISLHCWQGDDVAGFESGGDFGGSGLVATGAYPGKARSFDELRQDLEAAEAVIPGPLRLNLHAIYPSDLPKPVERTELGPDHFRSWVQWAVDRGWGLDFNPTCFNHPQAADGFTLSHRDATVRQFWIDHCRACRRIAATMARETGGPVVHNLWIPDGTKDRPADRIGPRQRLDESLRTIFSETLPGDEGHPVLDSVESKLFGIGVESYTVGSHEFYLAFATRHQIGLCLDAGHFHPTETLTDKISAVLPFVPFILLHLSRGVRWDSDHVVTLDDPTREVLEEVATDGVRQKVYLGLDFFDASINRVAAWAIGARNVRKGLLLGLLQPRELLRQAENAGDLTARLALFEDSRSLPWGAVWEEYCRRHQTPPDRQWLEEVRQYERTVLAGRNV